MCDIVLKYLTRPRLLTAEQIVINKIRSSYKESTYQMYNYLLHIQIITIKNKLE